MLYICNKCKDTFNKKSLLERHLSRKTPCTTNCPYCPMIFSNKESLAYHVNHKVCRNFSIYYCEECDILYKNKKFYDSHIKKFHYIPNPPIKDPIMSDFFA